MATVVVFASLKSEKDTLATTTQHIQSNAFVTVIAQGRAASDKPACPQCNAHWTSGSSNFP